MFRQAFALLNLFLILGTAWIGMALYFRAHPEASSGRGSRIISARVRAWYISCLAPLEELFVRRGVSPAALSWGQLVGSLVAGAAFAADLEFSGGFLVLMTGTLDILDGKVARRTNGQSRRGAFLDSVIDRYAEFASYAGLIVFFRSPVMAWVVLLAMLGGAMVSYTRARAEGLGVSCEVGLLQRPERFVILGFGAIFSAIAAHTLGGQLGEHRHILLAATVVVLAILSNITALQRALHVYRALDGPKHG